MRISASEKPYGLGAYREAIESGKAAIRHDKNLAAAQALLGDAHFKLGQMSQARTHYARAQEDSRFKDYVAHQIEELTEQPSSVSGPRLLVASNNRGKIRELRALLTAWTS